MNEILDFIKRRWQKDANWKNGNCYWFAYILKTRFPHLQIYYLPVEGHFVCKDEENFYDSEGIYTCCHNEEPCLFTQLALEDPLLYHRLCRDCIF